MERLRFKSSYEICVRKKKEEEEEKENLSALSDSEQYTSICRRNYLFCAKRIKLMQPKSKSPHLPGLKKQCR